MSNELPLDQQLSAALAAAKAATAEKEKALADAKAASDLAEQAQAALTAKANELATVSAELATTKAALESEKVSANEARAKNTELQAQFDRLKAAVASNPAMADAAAGRPPVSGDGSNAPKKTMTLAEFNARTPAERMAFSVNGGKIEG